MSGSENANGAPALPPAEIGGPVVELARQIFNEAKAGRVTSIATVLVTAEGAVSTPWAGQQQGDLYVGLAILQRRMLSSIENPPQRSSIIRASNMPDAAVLKR